jgi:hypothetical protein
MHQAGRAENLFAVSLRRFVEPVAANAIDGRNVVAATIHALPSAGTG